MENHSMMSDSILASLETLTQFYHLPERHIKTEWTLEDAYAFCKALTLSHYENFPVGSVMLPKKVRLHVYAIYAFARVADDYADEAIYLTPQNRLALLDEWQTLLSDCYQGKAKHPIFIALADTVDKIQLPIELFEGLLTAFKRDVTVNRYQTLDEVVEEYCRYSANPVGRLILHLFDYRDDDLFRLSDHICTALQLTNFWQDVAVDLKKDRIYIPLEDMSQHGYSVGQLVDQDVNSAYIEIMENLVRQTWALFDKGYPLLEKVRFPLNMELRFTWLGGVEILSRTAKNHYNVFTQRPRLSKVDFLALGVRSVFQIRRVCEQKRQWFAAHIPRER